MLYFTINGYPLFRQYPVRIVEYNRVSPWNKLSPKTGELEHSKMRGFDSSIVPAGPVLKG